MHLFTRFSEAQAHVSVYYDCVRVKCQPIIISSFWIRKSWQNMTQMNEQRWAAAAAVERLTTIVTKRKKKMCKNVCVLYTSKIPIMKSAMLRYNQKYARIYCIRDHTYSGRQHHHSEWFGINLDGACCATGKQRRE